jgi:hypothetical protein
VKSQVSPYKNYVEAKPSRLLLASLLNYGLVLVCLLLVFASSASPILYSLPQTGSRMANLSTLNTALKQRVGESRLESLSSDGSLSVVSEDASRYLWTLAKTSYYLHEENFPHYESASKTYVFSPVNETETFLNKGALDSQGNPTYPLDVPAYYFLSFKKETPSLSSYWYGGIDYQERKEEYLYSFAFGYQKEDEETYFVDSPSQTNSRFQELKQDQALILVDALVYGDSGTRSVTLKNRLAKAYETAVNGFIREMEEKDATYLSLFADFQANYHAYVVSYFLSLLCAYCVAFFLVEGLFPMLEKHHQSIGFLSLKLAYASKEEMIPSFAENARRFLVRFLLDFSSQGCLLFFLSSFGLCFVDLGSGFTFAYLLLASLLFSLASFFLILFLPSHQGLCELASSCLAKDLTLMENGTAKEEEIHGSGNA